MPRLLLTPKYTIPAVLITTLLVYSIVKSTGNLMGSAAVLLYIYFFGLQIGKLLLQRQRRGWQVSFGVLALLQLIIIPLSLIYWFFHINSAIIIAIVILLPALISLVRTAEEKEEDWIGIITGGLSETISSYLGTKVLSLFLLGSYVMILLFLAAKRYGDTLISPWTIISHKFLLLMAVLLVLQFIVFQISRHHVSHLFITILQYSIFLSMALLLFKYGFGFDPFIHQATEKWIATYGLILPKVPYYIGQYMLTVFLHDTTRVSIEIIDKLLVPVGASVFLPFTAYFCLSRRKLDDALLPSIAFLPFIPLAFFTFTTPNNLALLLAAILFFWLWYEEKNRDARSMLFGLLLAGGALAIHPLIGLPVTIIYLASLIIFRLNKKLFQSIALSFFGVILALILPLTFVLNTSRAGQTLALQTPLPHLNQFFALFRPATWYFFDHAPLAWKLLYWYKSVIPIMFLAIMGYGVWTSWKKYQSRLPLFCIFTAGGLFVSAFFLSTAIKFPSVISYEQNVFGERILQLALVFLLPFFIVGIREMFLKLRKKTALQWLAAILCSLLLIISWYFTYPTRDPVSKYTGYNVRDADIAAVRFIDTRAKSNCAGAESPPPSPCRGGLGRGLEGNNDYIVLANQMIGAAALHEFGFVNYRQTSDSLQYFYSIPTGGTLYKYFRKMVYEHPRREWMNEAMDYMGVKKAYFVHTNYWYPAAEIRDEAKKEADAWWEIGNGRVWVYEYTR